MKKIEQQMIDAIVKMLTGDRKKDWERDNTQVSVVDIENAPHIRVYLFGNLIATINRDKIQLRDSAWNTPTTRRRLNALGDSLASDFGAWRSVKGSAKCFDNQGNEVSKTKIVNYGYGREVETIATFETRW